MLSCFIFRNSFVGFLAKFGRTVPTIGAAFSPSKVKRFGGRKALPPHQAVLLLKAQLDGGHEGFFSARWDWSEIYSVIIYTCKERSFRNLPAKKPPKGLLSQSVKNHVVCLKGSLIFSLSNQQGI